MHDYWLTIKSDHYLCSSFYFCLIFCCETDSNTVSNCRSLNQMTPPCWYTIFVLDSNDTYPNHWTGTQSIWIGRFHPKLVNPIKGHIEIENTNWGSTPIEGHFTPIWQNWIKVGWEPPIQVVTLGATIFQNRVIMNPISPWIGICFEPSIGKNKEWTLKSTPGKCNTYPPLGSKFSQWEWDSKKNVVMTFSKSGATLTLILQKLPPIGYFERTNSGSIGCYIWKAIKSEIRLI